MTEFEQAIIAILQRFFDPRWWIAGVLIWTTYLLVAAGKLDGGAWAAMLPIAGGAIGLAAAAASSTTVREAAQKVLK